MESYRKELDSFCDHLNKCEVEYLIIGGLAVNFHGFQRATGDIDIWYNPTSENYSKLMQAIRGFGFETAEIDKQKYFKTKGIIRLPLERFTIELLSIIDGNFTFQQAYQKAETARIGEHSGNVMSYEYLIQNKIMARRPKDLE
ncbi:MAG: nucleotidyltransferase, partial [Cyclobacteriaceae bacterium]